MNAVNILFLIAHPDDAELMAGGSIARWTNEGHKVHVITFTDGVWMAPDGNTMRNHEEALREEKSAAQYLGCTVENLNRPAMDLQFDDALVREALTRIDSLNIDTIICPWEQDVHHDHEIVSRIAVAASRRVPRLLMGQINHYLREIFVPNLFVDISSTWVRKIEALERYRAEWARAGDDWYEFLDVTTRYYGKLCGVERAEGFVSRKYLLP